MAVILTDSEVKDLRTVVGFIVGYWPGLEDAIHWGSNENDDPRLHAAQRLANRLKQQ